MITLLLGLLILFFHYLISPSMDFLKLLKLLLFFSILFHFLSYSPSYSLSYLEGLFVLNSLNYFHLNFLSLLLLLFFLLNHINLFKDKILILFTNFLGLLFLIISNDLLIIFLSIELINLSLYLLICNYTSGIKYFLLSSILSTLFLISLSLLYSYYGHFHLDLLFSFIQFKYSTLGFLFFFLVLSFKLGLFPFYQWSPDLYQGISYPLMIFIQVLIKFAILILLYNLSSFFLPLNSLIYIIGILTMLIPSFLLNSQYNLQRFIALSSLAHLGFLILQFSYSYLFYLYIYSLSSLFFFFLLDFHSSHFLLKFLLTFLFFSFSGLPPFPGFYTKLYILIDLLNSNFLLLILILLFSSIILAAHYINLGFLSFHLSSSSSMLPYPLLLSIFYSIFLLFFILF